MGPEHSPNTTDTAAAQEALTMTDHRSDVGGTQPLEPDPARARGTTFADDLRVERVERDGRAGYRHDDRTDEHLGAVGSHQERRDPVEAAKDPDNRAKLLLAIAAMTALNLVLLMALLATVVTQSGEDVVVDGVPCIVTTQDGENVLYCRR
jgi:hypothetical protein